MFSGGIEVGPWLKMDQIEYLYMIFWIRCCCLISKCTEKNRYTEEELTKSFQDY